MLRSCRSRPIGRHPMNPWQVPDDVLPGPGPRLGARRRSRRLAVSPPLPAAARFCRACPLTARASSSHPTHDARGRVAHPCIGLTMKRVPHPLLRKAWDFILRPSPVLFLPASNTENCSSATIRAPQPSRVPPDCDACSEASPRACVHERR